MSDVEGTNRLMHILGPSGDRRAYRAQPIAIGGVEVEDAEPMFTPDGGEVEAIHRGGSPVDPGVLVLATLQSGEWRFDVDDA